MEQPFSGLPYIKPPDEIQAYHTARMRQGRLLAGLTDMSTPAESD